MCLLFIISAYRFLTGYSYKQIIINNADSGISLVYGIYLQSDVIYSNSANKQLLSIYYKPPILEGNKSLNSKYSASGFCRKFPLCPDFLPGVTQSSRDCHTSKKNHHVAVISSARPFTYHKHSMTDPRLLTQLSTVPLTSIGLLILQIQYYFLLFIYSLLCNIENTSGLHDKKVQHLRTHF